MGHCCSYSHRTDWSKGSFAGAGPISWNVQMPFNLMFSFLVEMRLWKTLEIHLFGLAYYTHTRRL